MIDLGIHISYHSKGQQEQPVTTTKKGERIGQQLKITQNYSIKGPLTCNFLTYIQPLLYGLSLMERLELHTQTEGPLGPEVCVCVYLKPNQ